MTQATRRERGRTGTDRDIRRQARALLVSDGPQAVTLRAIARELGITAPALYRYYASREDLIEHLRADVCDDLAVHLADGLAEVPESDHLGQVLAVCRGFRRWALAHPQEFTLVFASPSGHASNHHLARGSFGRIFLTVAGRVLASGPWATQPDSAVPDALRADLAAFRLDLLANMARNGLDVPENRLGVGTAFAMLRFWVRLYGQVALEVFGQLPMPVVDAAPLFEAMLADLTEEIGLR
ncbi:TetR/AcrR family transcriptional regulator [Actinokineospora iranica]|uniref:DNA-binding transcriptional regulator, AcrR family n=1 Tax=Actinokineospora iranica TaxID=1271860 RepID=A0A1G6PKX1_9PSEU|nr:TetR/AcrR family transcriptional regulator [Actinokineospora iranica]SDC80813.1 DNA-binding transcriptional regulator, AcrR family [Actinokineospora iranica]